MFTQHSPANIITTIVHHAELRTLRDAISVPSAVASKSKCIAQQHANSRAQITYMREHKATQQCENM
jgi:hypothetical protein